jgi:hypothetical protein
MLALCWGVRKRLSSFVFDIENFRHDADSVLFDGRSSYSSFDHLVGAGEQHWRNFEAERLRSSEIYD